MNLDSKSSEGKQTKKTKCLIRNWVKKQNEIKPELANKHIYFENRTGTKEKRKPNIPTQKILI